MTIAVCIPSIGRSGSMLNDLVAVCVNEPDVAVVEVWDNSDCGGTVAPIPGAEIVYASGLTIYQEFNAFAECYGNECDLAILNDDIVLTPSSLGKLVAALDEGYRLVSGTDRPNGSGIRPTQGTRRNGGIRSEAFVVAQGCWPQSGIDERFKVWYGDDDLLWNIRREGGEIAVHEGVYVEHRHSTTLHTLAWVPEAQAADGKLWYETLGRR